MKVDITIKQLKNSLKKIKLIKENGDTEQLYRVGGFLEGILYTLGEIKPKEEFVFEDVEYVKRNWIGKKKIKKRKQTYTELMIQKTESLIKKYDEGLEISTSISKIIKKDYKEDVEDAIEKALKKMFYYLYNDTKKDENKDLSLSEYFNKVDELFSLFFPDDNEDDEK